MNVLPLIFILLSVFALFAATSQHHLIQTAIIQREYLSYQQADRIARKRAFVHALEKKQQKSSTKQDKQASKKGPLKKEIISKRDWRKLETRQGMNLAPLMTMQDEELKKAKEAIFAWLDYLYRNCPFYSSETSHSFIERILVIAKENTNTQTLQDLFLLDNASDETIYLMMQGTSIVDIEKGRGIPPLNTFLCFAPDIPGILQWKYTSEPLIQILLGPDVAKKIQQLEKEHSQETHRHKSAEFQDFKEFFSHDPNLTSTIQFWQDHSCSSKRGRKIHSAQDPGTGIRAQIQAFNI